MQDVNISENKKSRIDLSCDLLPEMDKMEINMRIQTFKYKLMPNRFSRSIEKGLKYIHFWA